MNNKADILEQIGLLLIFSPLNNEKKLDVLITLGELEEEELKNTLDTLKIHLAGIIVDNLPQQKANNNPNLSFSNIRRPNQNKIIGKNKDQSKNTKRRSTQKISTPSDSAKKIVDDHCGAYDVLFPATNASGTFTGPKWIFDLFSPQMLGV